MASVWLCSWMFEDALTRSWIGGVFEQRTRDLVVTAPVARGSLLMLEKLLT